VNLVYSSWVSDLNYSPHLRGCVHAASRFSQETGIVLIRHNEEVIAVGEVQFHRSTLEHFLKWSNLSDLGRKRTFKTIKTWFVGL
jgi:hypothetical protein